METTTRNADLGTLMSMLQHQHARKVDIVAPATTIRSEGGVLVVTGAEPEITDEGVTTADGRYAPTTVALEGISDKLGIPIKYVRRMHADRPDLFDANVNGWLHGAGAEVYTNPLTSTTEVTASSPDSRSFLLRCFKGDDDGICRAFLSDTYKVIDNIDVLMATLDGIRATGMNVNITGGDITERRMRVRIECPEVKALAPVLLKGYRNPFEGRTGPHGEPDGDPTVFAGFEIANSEVGGGAFTITPRLVIQICKNGLTITKDALRNVHLGGRLEAGVVRWSTETQQKNLELVKSQTRDAVTTFLDVDYVTKVIEQAEERCEEPVATVDQVKDVTKPLGFTDAEIDSVLTYFIQGGQTTRGGVFNAVTASAQDIEDGDRAAEVEAAAASILL